MKTMKYLCGLLLLSATLPTNAYGVIFVAASCSLSDVQTAINAASAGDTVVIPDGSCVSDWGTSGAYLQVDKAITLRGYGDTTVLTLASTAGTYSSATIRISAAATLRDFKIQTQESGGCKTAFSMGTGGDWRLTNITYVNRTTTIDGYFAYINEVYGLIDNCDITGNAGTNELIFAKGPTDSWQTVHSMGGSDNLIIENNYFRGSGYVTDCNANSRCVVRYNTINGQMKADGHGKASNTPPRGVRHMEIYQNHWTPTAGFYNTVELRGGTGRIFNNHSSTTQTAWQFREYAATALWSNFDNMCQCPDDYPVDDQIGVGMDPKSAASEPVYAWNNQENGTQITWVRGDWLLTGSNVCQQVDQCGPEYTEITQITGDRDYYSSNTKPSAVADYEPFRCPDPRVGAGVCAGGDTYGVGGYRTNGVGLRKVSGRRVSGRTL